MRIGRRAALAALCGSLVAIAPAAARADEAPGAPGAKPTWTTGAKQGLGTATTRSSEVWHTLADGAMSEVYYPAVDVADVRDLRFLVTDGATFTDDETTDTTHRIELADAHALTYRQINTAKSGRYRLIKTYITDPARSTVLLRVRLVHLGGDRTPLHVYARFDPSIANTGTGDSGASRPGALVVSDGGIAAALTQKGGFKTTTNGFVGSPSDIAQQLAADHDLTASYDRATDGNVVQGAELRLDTSGSATLALGFGGSDDEALATARASLRAPFWLQALRYRGGWASYLRSLDPVPVGRDLRTQYDVAVMTLRAHEDKRHPGANVASLTVPWGEAVDASQPGVGGYHLVWSRDLYEVATALMTAGDTAGARRALDYLFDVQQKPDGSFPQNSYLDGRPYWPSLQLDEVAFPIVLASQLGRTDSTTWRNHVKPAADFIVGHGPATPQERWEEEGGYSPSTIAAEIAGLICAADIAAANGDAASAALYRGVADDWQRRVESWTFTEHGPLGDGRYFERIDQAGKPNEDAPLSINNGGGTFNEDEIVDAGFLELVRLGVRAPDDASVAASLPEIDSTIAVDTPNGRMYYRYNHDGYGEKANGDPYDGTGVGRLWPLLSGERGEYELANGRSADAQLRTMARAANAGYLIPEQVWDRPDPTAHGFVFGEGTGSATPLAWSMAQFVRLAQDIKAGRVLERPHNVAARYASGQPPAGRALHVTSPADGAIVDTATATVAGTTDPGAEVTINAGGTTTTADVADDGTFSADVALTLGTNQITVVATGANGGTTVTQLTVTSAYFGTQVGALDDPAGDDNGPGSYVYPGDGAFNAGAFDLTRFAVYEQGDQVRLVTTIGGELRNPWGGNQMSVQRLNVYVRGAGTGATPALPGLNANLAAPWSRVVVADGFSGTTVRDAGNGEVASATLLALPATRQIVISLPRSALGDADPATAAYAVTMLSHAASDEGAGEVRPVYDLAYWSSTVGTDMSWIHDFRFGGGAGQWTADNAAHDTDTTDPNIIDVTLPAGSEQSTVLDWHAGALVTIPYAALGH